MANHIPTKTSFKKGYKRSSQSIEKQRQTMIKQFTEGKRRPSNNFFILNSP